MKILRKVWNNILDSERSQGYQTSKHVLIFYTS